MTYIVEISPGVWLSGASGDPGRTLHSGTAKRYATLRGAQIALGLARKYRKLENAAIYEVTEP